MPVFLAPPTPPPPPPSIVFIDRDNVAITTSCSVRLGDAPIPDTDGNGVVHIAGDGIVVDFGGTTLRGAPATTTPDALVGIGVRVTGKNVTVRNLRLDGFKVGLLAEKMTSGTIEDIAVLRNFGQHLKSTTAAEDGADWLWPHRNDEHEWRTNYGAAVCVEQSSHVTLRRIVVRQSQNGIMLDRVDSSQVYDNDCSFLSGWGLSMWRSNANTISRNAFDFCIRGYSHGVYSRGQDSAGILMFEQCSRNRFYENSATHGGDGFFGFAGREALGEAPPPADAPADFHARRGSNGNVFIGNDFSHAAAHGLELTFSFENVIVRNRFHGNGFCGIWGGYSQDTLVAHNEFVGNGGAGAGLERAGIAIEHSVSNRFAVNHFKRNACGLALWWDADGGLLKLPWAKVNPTETRDNLVEFNIFEDDAVGVLLREADRTRLIANTMSDVATPIDADERSRATLANELASAPFSLMSPDATPIGDTRPVGARAALAGREKIIMTEWGPYDWARPLLVPGASADARGERIGADTWRILGPIAPRATTIVADGDAHAELLAGIDRERATVVVSGDAEGTVAPYRLIVTLEDGTALSARGMLVNPRWSVRAFPWTIDPRNDAAGWRAQADRATALVAAPAPGGALDLPFGGQGPVALSFSNRLRSPAAPAAFDLALGDDRFGTIATTTLRFPPGRYAIRTTSDDGIRVRVNEKLVIDDWTWHAPREHRAELIFDTETTATIEVEHFELDGFAVLRVGFERLP